MKLVLTKFDNLFDNIDENFEMVINSAVSYQSQLEGADILVLPELIGTTCETTKYQHWVSELAQLLCCTVVGGSHHNSQGSATVNSGVVSDPKGQIIARYDKQMPYGSELSSDIVPGNKQGQFTLQGRNIVTWICSDLWFSDRFHQLKTAPDLVLIPSFSISKVATPKHAQQLWEHMCVARAYEFSTYIGVSDWAYPCDYHGLKSSGVSGFADPKPTASNSGSEFFTPLKTALFKSFDIDFDKLDQHRESKHKRGFLWQPKVLV